MRHFSLGGERLVGVRCLVTLLLLLCAGTVFSAELRTEVDRETVIDGETVVLYIHGSDLSGMPDTSVLLPSFRIIQSGVSSSQQIVQGVSTRGYIVRLELQAKNTGPSVIPAFTVDNVSSDPIAIDVVARGTPGVAPRDNVFVELSVDKPAPYVQEQVVLSLKIFDDGKLASADPAISGNSDYQIERLPSGGEDIVTRNGTEYRLNTFRYALFPQKSGELVIGPISIPASVRDRSYGGNLILRNTPTRRIELVTEPLTLDIKPRADLSTSGWWLPVKGLQLKHAWSADVDDAKVGEAFTLTLELIASGATSTQLPEIAVPDVPGLRIYSDTPKFGSQAEVDNVVSLRREKWSVIPNKAGSVIMPAIDIKWWDTINDTEQVVTLPSREIQIEPGDGTQTVAQLPETPSPVEPSSEPETAVPEDASDASADDVTDAQASALFSSEIPAPGIFSGIVDGRRVAVWWQWLALAAMAVWAATLLAWWWSSRRTQSHEVPDEDVELVEADEWRRVQAAMKQQNTERYREALLQWASARWPHRSVHNLPSIGKLLRSKKVSDQMRQLDKMRYSKQHATGGHSVSLSDIHHQLELAVKQDNQIRPAFAAAALPQL